MKQLKVENKITKRQEQFYNYVGEIMREFAGTNDVIEGVGRTQVEGRRTENYFILASVLPPVSLEYKRILPDMRRDRNNDLKPEREEPGASAMPSADDEYSNDDRPHEEG